ncbi:MAG: DUF4012 domain-containing protein [Patescibacteria group bacterium]|jgi:uncharacterized protein YihD (DUF1040 family)|nr:DUF4012 domain-containing protein [Patescibacteria group bacterium]
MFKTIKIVIISTSILLLFFIVLFFGSFLHLKNIYSHTIIAKDNLEQSAELMKSREFSLARTKAGVSYDNFSSAMGALENIQENFIFSRIETSNNILRDVSFVLSAGVNLSKASVRIADLGLGVESLLTNNPDRSFESLDSVQKRELLKLIYESSPEFHGIKANIDLSIDSLVSINPNGVFYPIKDQLSELEEKIREASELMNKVLPISEMLPKLAGYPTKSNYLIVLQNSDELRPTGGFIGTYGILQMDSGEIERLDTHDIYHLDMPVQDKINVTPPEPIAKYLVDKWYMRDSNWSPDWKESAQKIEWFYDLENSKFPEPDIDDFVGVIGITPDFVNDLLEFTGPLEVNGEIYNKDNFVDLLQYKVEKEYVFLGVSSWHRKEEVGDILSKLKKELLSMSTDRLPEVINLIDDNLARKNILFYFNDLGIQEVAKNSNYSGEIKDTDGDFVMVVDANMAAYKTDAVMGKAIEYSVDQSVGGLFAKLKINYSHRGLFDWKTTRYRSYTRVYVPKGSQLIKSWGGSDEPVVIYDEGDKTVFAGFISIEPGKINNIYLEYKLPDSLNLDTIAKNEYSLYFQKQPGAKIEELKVNLNFDSIIESYKPVGFFVNNKEGDRIIWTADLEIDREFKINF